MEVETRTTDERKRYWKSRLPKLQCGVNRNSEPYVRFSVKFPHFQSRPDLPPDRSSRALRRRMFRHPAPASAASHEPLTTGAIAQQGVAQVSNAVSVLNLGAIPNPAAAAATSSSSGNHNNY